MTGVNYPWTVFRGAPNYGCDFGRNIWGSHSGVTAHRDEVRADLESMASIGLEIVRWFVFSDGRGGVSWDSNGDVAGLAPAFFDDMDAALEMACAAGVRLCLVLFDYSWMLHREEHDETGALLFTTRPDLLATSTGCRRVIETLVDPLLDRYGSGGEQQALGDAIHSFDIINEPDWVTRSLASDRSRDPATGDRHLKRPFSRTELRAFVGSLADRIHDRGQAQVTVGGGRVRFASEWDHPAYGLDFVQVHSYPDIRHPRRDTMLMGRSAGSLGVSKPVLIGEFPARGEAAHPPDHLPPAFSLEDYLDLARDGGFLGAWPWSFKGVDSFGAVDANAMRAWIARAGQLEESLRSWVVRSRRS